MTTTGNDELEALERDLKTARDELEWWQDYDRRREDGSGAQDARHAETGRSLQERVRELTDKLAKV